MWRDQAQTLLRKAADDLGLLRLLQQQAAGTDEQFGFHTQQAVEKAIKSVLARRRISYPWTHDLTRLILLLDTSGISYPKALRDADLYTYFAVQFRYEDLPDIAAGSTPAFDRAHALMTAESAVQWATAEHASTS